MDNILQFQVNETLPVKQVLVVEDDPDISEVIDSLLSEEGYQVFCSSSGRKAQELLRKLRFDLITLDLNLEDMNGNEFLRGLSQYAPAVPVVVVSAVAYRLMPHPQVKSVIDKPFDIEIFLNTIQKIA